MVRAMLRTIALLCISRACTAAVMSAQDVEIETSWDHDADAVYASLGTRRFTARPVSRSGSGVVYSAAGEREFVQREVLPTVEYLRRELRVGDARGPGASATRPCGFALFTERSLVATLATKETSALDAFFDRILLYEDWRVAGVPEKLPLKARAKIVKIHAMVTSPFETTIFLDFDARPCMARFVDFLFPLVAGDADVALTNKFDGQAELAPDLHLRLEHNSACVVLDSTSPRTAQLLTYYLEAFLGLNQRSGEARDQPALTVALKKAALGSPDPLRHADMSPTTFCRNKISPIVSCDAGCALVHKPQKHDLSFKTFVVGAKRTGITSVAMMLDALKLEPKCDVASRLRAADAVALGRGAERYAVAVETAGRYRTFYDAPWNDGDLYATLATAYPRAKFVLTVRDGADWWADVDDMLRCAPRLQKERYAATLGLTWDDDGAAAAASVPAHAWGGLFGQLRDERRAPASRAARFVAAYERRNAAVEAFFRGRDESHRLLVLKDPLESSAYRVWTSVCNFLEAWSACPRTRGLPGASALAERKKRRADGDAAPCPAAGSASPLQRGSFSLADRERLTGLAPPADAAERQPAARGARLRLYKQRVAAYLNTTKQASTTPPKPPGPRKSLPRSQRLALKRAYEAKLVPAWHPECAPRRPRGVLYNRIPKSGSASIMSWMSGQLNETAKFKHGMDVTNVTWWTPHIAKHRWLDGAAEREYVDSIREYGALGRFVTQRHVYYTDVRHAHEEGVELINIARDPIDRCISRYNYEAFYKKRLPPVDFDECLDGGRCDIRGWRVSTGEQHVYQDYPVPSKRANAKEWKKFQRLSYNQSMALLLDECNDYMTRWFCGHGPECRDERDPGKALDVAKRHVRDAYAHVGVLEDLPNTAQLFRLLLPDFFEGDPDHTPDEADFPALHSEKSNAMKLQALLNKQVKSGPLSPHNLDLLHETNKRDVELYYYILELHRRRVRLCLRTNGTNTGPATRDPEGSVHPDWAAKDVTALLAVKARPAAL